MKKDIHPTKNIGLKREWKQRHIRLNIRSSMLLEPVIPPNMVVIRYNMTTSNETDGLTCTIPRRRRLNFNYLSTWDGLIQNPKPQWSSNINNHRKHQNCNNKLAGHWESQLARSLRTTVAERTQVMPNTVNHINRRNEEQSLQFLQAAKKHKKEQLYFNHIPNSPKYSIWPLKNLSPIFIFSDESAVLVGMEDA